MAGMGYPTLSARGSPGRSPLRSALALLATVFVALGIAVYAACAIAGTAPGWVFALYTGVGVEYALVGIVAWVRRPSNRVGLLLCLGGLSLLFSAAQNAAAPALVAAGLICAELPFAVILHVLLAFPSGRLRGRLPHLLVACGYVVTVVLEAPRYVYSANATVVRNPLLLADRPDLVLRGKVVQDSAGAIVLAAAALLVGLRLSRAPVTQRRVLLLLYPAGILAILLIELAAHVLPPLFGFGPVGVFVVQICALAVLPVSFVLGVLRGGFARTVEIQELGAWLGATAHTRPDLRSALAHALGDPSLELLFSLPGRGYVDADGRDSDPAGPDAGRAWEEIELDGARVGAIVYDPAVVGDAETVKSAGRIVALALERDRLTAELLAGRRALRESRARLVNAADDERLRIARDLHDGLQGRLVVAAMRAGTLAEAPLPAPLRAGAGALRRELEDAAGELRRLVQGVMPALLIERGLYAAVRDLADSLPLRTRLDLPADTVEALPPEVERTGYFVVSEALTNALKHSGARELRVRLRRDDGQLIIHVADDGNGQAALDGGSGLRGIADRVDVLGGRLSLTSQPDSGTSLIAELPCGS